MVNVVVFGHSNPAVKVESSLSTPTSVKQTSRVCPCLSVLPLFADGHLVPVPAISILERVDCGKVPLLYAAVASNRVLYAVLMPGVKHTWHC